VGERARFRGVKERERERERREVRSQLSTRRVPRVERYEKGVKLTRSIPPTLMIEPLLPIQVLKETLVLFSTEEVEVSDFWEKGKGNERKGKRSAFARLRTRGYGDLGDG